QSPLEHFLNRIEGYQCIDTAALATATARPTARNGQMANMPYIPRRGWLNLSIDNQRGPNHSIGGEQEQATKTASRPEVILAQHSCIHIDMESSGQIIACLQQITQGETIQRR